MNDRSNALSLSLAAVLAATLLGCSSSGSEAKPSSSAATTSSTARASTSASPAATAPTPKPAAAKTTGEVELPGSKKKVAYSIELPDGLKDVSEVPGGVKAYRKDKTSFDSFGFNVLDAPGEWVKAGLDGTLDHLKKDPDFVKNKVKILDQGKTETGWYFTYSLEESGKKAVTAALLITKGDVTLMCQGEVEGPLAEKSEESTKAMLETCKTLSITSP